MTLYGLICRIVVIFFAVHKHFFFFPILQNNSSELNQTDGFLSSILNDEDLQLMDMAMNEGKRNYIFKKLLQADFIVNGVKKSHLFL